MHNLVHCVNTSPFVCLLSSLVQDITALKCLRFSMGKWLQGTSRTEMSDDLANDELRVMNLDSLYDSELIDSAQHEWVSIPGYPKHFCSIHQTHLSSICVLFPV